MYSLRAEDIPSSLDRLYNFLEFTKGSSNTGREIMRLRLISLQARCRMPHASDLKRELNNAQNKFVLILL